MAVCPKKIREVNLLSVANHMPATEPYAKLTQA